MLMVDIDIKLSSALTVGIAIGVVLFWSRCRRLSSVAIRPVKVIRVVLLETTLTRGFKITE